MSCPECDSWRARGAKYCAACGNPLTSGDGGCPECAGWEAKEANYCMACGRRLSPPAPPRRKGAKHPGLHKAVTICTIIVAAVAALSLIYDAVHGADILWDIKDLSVRTGLFYPTFDGVDCFPRIWIGGVGIWALFVVDVSVISAFTAYAGYKCLRKRETGADTDELERTGLAAASSILCASLFVSVSYLLITSAFGDRVDISWMDTYTDYQMAFNLTNAGLMEEIEFRAAWIGIPMMAIGYIYARDRKSWQYLLGGFGMSRAAFALIIASSIIFGLAHYSGWGWVKVPNAAIAGILFGYLYVEYGLYASVLAHFVNDMLSSVGWMLGSGIEGLVMLSMIVLGLVVVVYWVVKPNRAAVRVRGMPWLGELEDGIAAQWGRH